MRQSILAVVVGGSLVLGCGSNEATVGLVDAGTGSFNFEGGRTDHTTSLDVSIAAQSPVICPAQCVTLSAHASGGTSPYSYKWDHGLTADGPSVKVCPETTTTYSVNVTDSSGRGELPTGTESGSANITLTVLPSCTDAAPPPIAGDRDAEMDLDAPLDGDADDMCGDPGNAPWSGCETVIADLKSMPPSPATFSTCGKVRDQGDQVVAMCLPKPLLAGQTYQLEIDFTIDGTGPALPPVPYMGMWGSTNTCYLSEELFHQQMGWPSLSVESWSGVCVKASANYPQVVAGILQQNGTNVRASQITVKLCTTVCDPSD